MRHVVEHCNSPKVEGQLKDVNDKLDELSEQVDASLLLATSGKWNKLLLL